MVSLASEKTENLQKPQCMLFGTVFYTANLKPSKQKEQLDNQHGGASVVGHDEKSLRDKKLVDFRGSLRKLDFVSVDKPMLTTSYQVVFKLAKSYKFHTITEELNKPYVLEIATTILGKKQERRLN